MVQPSTPPNHVRKPGQRGDLRLRFDCPEAFREEYEQNISRGALFVATEDPYDPHETVDVTLELAFCGESLTVSGEVIVAVDPALADAGSTTAGISIRLDASVAELKDRLERHSGVSLAQRNRTLGADRRAAARARSDADIRIETPDAEFMGTTANVCYTGVLALLNRASIAIGTDVRVHLSNPAVELDLSVDGKIIHRRRCDGGQIAHGIQLLYPADRIDEVMSFIEFLQSFDRARRLATVSGPIDSSGLGAVLDMFVNTAPSGTLSVFRGKDEGKIVFSENEILRCTLGMVSGMKALARMCRWTDGRFEFHHELQLVGEADEPQPIEEALINASVQVDELSRIDRGDLGPSDAFEVVPERLRGLGGALTAVEQEVLDYAAAGFNVEAIFDVITATDADVYKALSALRAQGVIKTR